MTIDEAIKRIKARINRESYHGDPEYLDDLKLGIEALKVIERQRESMRAEYFTQLPGETEK